MPTFRKTVMRPATYRTPEGPAVVTPARIKHWTDSIKAMGEAGIKIPLSWGHVSDALPHTPDDAAYWASKSVAGTVNDADISPATGEMSFTAESSAVGIDEAGNLTSTLELPDGRRAPTAIGEVSVGVRDWTDGTGRLWRDAPVHIALTPLPVVGNQTPFTLAASCLSFGAANMLTPFSADGKPEPAEPPAGSEAAGPDAPRGDGPPGASAEKVVAKLAKCGVVLPKDTDASNILERLYVACTAMETAMTATDTTAQTAGAKEEQGTYLSTIRSDPAGAALIARFERQERADRLDRIAKLAGKGLPAHRAKQLREEATAQRFSLAADGASERTALDEKLDLMEEVLDGTLHGRQLFGRSVAEALAPEDDAGGATGKARRLADEQAKSSRLPARA